MRKFLMVGFAGALAFAATVPRLLHADTLLIGQLSFDSGTSPTSNTLDLFNYTLDTAADPGTVVDSELFSGALLVQFAGGSTMSYLFDNVGPGSLTLASVPTNDNILSATLSLSLSKTAGVNITDSLGNAGVVNLLSVPSITLPLVSHATALTPCDGSGSPCSQALISVDTASPSLVPEPQTLWLMMTGMGSAAAFGLRRHLR